MSEEAYSEKFDEAVLLAMTSFRFKLRKATKVPYLTHLMSVCALVGEHGGDEEQMIAAILHDYLEDIRNGTEEQLRERFGDRVARLVVALSDTTEFPKPPWKERKEKYLVHLGDEPHEVKLICAADKLHNCRSIFRDHREMGEAIFDRFTPEKHQTLWYFREVVESLSNDWVHPLLEELRDAVHDLHRVASSSI